ncbi:guanine nucleotide-binding protein (G protein), subunit alpha [Oopsacas minuta]|uniref:Guanine nucleotide-binding protein (G protein), subunit alpha n=1 Tax=Oopsacas minuta TaxID=111878 RepID=A0AAV7K3V7_9METZ|nr:guanine nucleotide-binding protein (G protein), subunit alpha [Oopsacas minuta]
MCAPSDEASQQSRKIDKFITDDLKRTKSELRVLLLGTGESGKTTVIKQMRINYGDGFDQESRAKLRPNIYRNIYNAVHYIINGMDTLGLKYAKSSITDREIDSLLEVDLNAIRDQISDRHKILIKKFLADSNVKTCIQQHEKIHMTKSAVDFLDKIDEIFNPDYIPSIQDILLERTPSTGIKEYMFGLKHGGNKYNFRMMDVGGQKNERRKWIHAFERVNAVIFLTAISEYDQELEEEPGSNRLSGSADLFQQVANLEWFPARDTSLILFLNKIDLFDVKMKTISFKKYFPSYTGRDLNPDSVKSYIQQLFFSQAPKRNIVSHYTCAIDTKQIKKIFEAVKANLIERHLNIITGVMPKHKKHLVKGSKHVSKIIGSDDEIQSTDESVRSADSLSIEDDKPSILAGTTHTISRLSSSSIEDFPSTRSHIRDPLNLSKPALTERQQLNLLLKSTAEEPPRSPNPLTLPSHKKQLPRVQRRNAQGETPLHLASIRGELSTAMDLVAQGAQVNTPDNAGWTPLHEAANFGHTSLVAFLLRCGAKANAQSIDRETPLHDAALSGHEKICKLLLHYGANPLNVNKDGKTAIDLTESSNIKQILSDPKQSRNRGKKSKQFQQIPALPSSDNEDSSFVFTYAEFDSPTEKHSLPSDTPSSLPPEKSDPIPSGISGTLDSYTSKWASESSTDETRESELSPTIVSKLSKLTSEHPKMIHNRNSNNSEKKKKKHKKDLRHEKVSRSSDKKLFSQEDETPSKSSDNELFRLNSPMEEGTPQKRSQQQSDRNKSDTVKHKKKESSNTISIHHRDISTHISPVEHTPYVSAPKPGKSISQGKQKRLSKRTADLLSDTSDENHVTFKSKLDTDKVSKSSDQKEGVVSLLDDLSWISELPPPKRIRPVNHSTLVQRRCEKSNPSILPTNYEEFLSYRQDYPSNRIDPTGPLVHSYNFPPDLMALYEEQERARLVIAKRHTQEREQLELTYEQELLRVYQRSARATPPPSACAVLSSASRLQQGINSPIVSPLDPPTQQYDPNLLRNLVQDLYDKFKKLIQNLTARQKSDCDALYFTQIESWDSCVQSQSTVQPPVIDSNKQITTTHLV